MSNDIKVKIRSYRPDDCATLLSLLCDTVHSVNCKDYTKTQLNAWTRGCDDTERWHRSFRSNKTFVAESGGEVVGFGSLDIGFECSVCARGTVHLLYVHKDCQRKGVGREILKALENYAQETAVSELSVYASITAKPFFSAMGYRFVRDNTVERNGIEIKNYLMRKTLDSYE